MMKTSGYPGRYVARIYFALGAALLLGTITASAQMPAGGALVTQATGTLTRGSTESGQHVEAFSRLREGDQVSLNPSSRLRLVYFPNGRQETWSGNGRLVIGSEASKASGRLDAQVVQLPDILVRQIAKTPSADGQARAGMTRLRAIASTEQINKIENTYKQLRSQAKDDDLNPEMYLLASYLEMRELDRVEQIMQDLRARRSNDLQALALLGVYQRAVREAREAVRSN